MSDQRNTIGQCTELVTKMKVRHVLKEASIDRNCPILAESKDVIW